MRDLFDIFKTIAICLLVLVGAVVLMIVLPLVALMLLAGPLLAVAGLVAGLFLTGTVTAYMFATTPTAVGGGLAVAAVIRDATS
jgi:hypothetical protein